MFENVTCIRWYANFQEISQISPQKEIFSLCDVLVDNLTSASVKTFLGKGFIPQNCQFSHNIGILFDKVSGRARPGFEPGTSRTQSENHTPRPTSLASLSIFSLFEARRMCEHCIFQLCKKQPLTQPAQKLDYSEWLRELGDLEGLVRDLNPGPLAP